METESSFGEDIGELLEDVKSVVKYILNNSIDKLPIKKSEIVAHGLGGKKLSPTLIGLVKEKLKEIYGINLIEVPDAKPPIFICVSEFPAGSVFEYSKKEQSQITLLFLILSYIFMRGSPVNEDYLFKFLDKIKIPVDTAQTAHSFFGSNIKKLISETFVRQLYLKKREISQEASQHNEIVYEWGFRSEQEFPKKAILRHVAKILDKPEICFVQQYREVYGEDEDVEMKDEP